LKNRSLDPHKNLLISSAKIWFSSIFKNAKNQSLNKITIKLKNGKSLLLVNHSV